MSKIVLNNVVSLIDATTAATTINGNNTTVTTAFDNTLSRDGTQPNQMLSNLDLNSFQIINLPPPLTNQSPLRLQDLTNFLGTGTVTLFPVGGTTNQILTKLSNVDYNVGWAGLSTSSFVNGVTGTGAIVLANSPVMTTPTLGVALVSSINGLAITATSGAALAIVNNKTLTVNSTLTLAGTDATTLTFQGTDTYVGRATTDILTNKTYDTAGTGNSFLINGLAATANTGTGSVVRATTPTLVTPVLGAATGTSLATTGAITSSGTAGIGYATGAGGTVTQITNRTTGVTLNTISGAITLFAQVNTAISGATAQTFTVTNSTVAATDLIIVNQKSGTDKYLIFVTNVATGSFQITNYTTGGTTNESPVFSFNVMKGVIS